MADVVLSGKPLAVSPLKVSQPVGASLAFLGLARAMPLEHGARGCTSFNKLFFMRHFQEPIALQTTAMDQVTTVIGADGNVVEALHTIAERNAPEVIGLITTALSETQGADIPRTVRLFRSTHPQHDPIAVVPVSASDTLGCLETGFAAAVEAIIATLVPQSPPTVRRPRQVNVLASSMLSPGDIEAIKEWIEAFGLQPIVLPDIGDSLDGHMIDAGFATLTYGGTPRAAIATMGESLATLVIGRSLTRAADLLHARTGVPDHRFPGLTGVEACDAFTQTLSQLSRRAVPERIGRQRAQLLDAMVDCHFQLGGARIAVAADGDLLEVFLRFFGGAGAEVVAAVAAARSRSLADLPIGRVVVGDLEDLEREARAGKAELLVANAHAVETAAHLNVQLLRAGFPLNDVYGGHTRCLVGYRGSRQALFDSANLLAMRQRAVAPYRSIYWQGTARDQEVVAPAAGTH
ncbi:Nitrogenase iron-molybdenum cofactor biosynthesis protein NifN [Rhodovastum atsumiense]|uniref:Nitrogenase iron-molybdenum cofactor biosynthesis protein NifN n=1 Tax=Rhodovastum atsumiense TaxID=504468 RepID=A0A5M6J0M8_9PROT|nr:nitrogenase iron-molybdenum cofactor biosynthesis protein NifN [Rhodovastum atsumiense]KAA5614061.1 nitrogenase iron-molybdenum cofactor biosynthesis protein NifN [Rhodovastum atsumiense]CAH2598877.1 Nitrogenase iron-molybdenum cofactor biosynthesis protein NifN [Rhodovastum atsumiense]